MNGSIDHSPKDLFTKHKLTIDWHQFLIDHFCVAIVGLHNYTVSISSPPLMDDYIFIMTNWINSFFKYCNPYMIIEHCHLTNNVQCLPPQWICRKHTQAKEVHIALKVYTQYPLAYIIDRYWWTNIQYIMFFALGRKLTRIICSGTYIQAPYNFASFCILLQHYQFSCSIWKIMLCNFVPYCIHWKPKVDDLAIKMTGYCIYLLIQPTLLMQWS